MINRKLSRRLWWVGLLDDGRSIPSRPGKEFQELHIMALIVQIAEFGGVVPNQERLAALS